MDTVDIITKLLSAVLIGGIIGAEGSIITNRPDCVR